ncbi:MAG: hypothetical protein AB8B67_04750 [Rickettsiaceae bacterium]
MNQINKNRNMQANYVNDEQFVEILARFDSIEEKLQKKEELDYVQSLTDQLAQNLEKNQFDKSQSNIIIERIKNVLKLINEAQEDLAKQQKHLIHTDKAIKNYTKSNQY